MPTQANPAPGESRRHKIFLETATVLEQQEFSGQQYVLRMHAPAIAEHAYPGQFVHIRCDHNLLMRRPYSIMSTTDNGDIEILYRVVGAGSSKLASKKKADRLSCLGPIGNGFKVHSERPNLLLIGGGVGIPPIFFLALEAHKMGYRSIVLIGSERGLPFASTHSSLPIAGCSSETSLAAQVLEDLAIPSRIASQSEIAGSHRGYLDSLARLWLAASGLPHSEVEIFACGPEPMLHSIAQLAFEFDIDCQLAVEEYMACGVGGCAGCTIPIRTQGRTAMKRVCVDGPVFTAKEIFFDDQCGT